jgi:hypothetical protein
VKQTIIGKVKIRKNAATGICERYSCRLFMSSWRKTVAVDRAGIATTSPQHPNDCRSQQAWLNDKIAPWRVDAQRGSIEDLTRRRSLSSASAKFQVSTLLNAPSAFPIVGGSNADTGSLFTLIADRTDKAWASLRTFS